MGPLLEAPRNQGALRKFGDHNQSSLALTATCEMKALGLRQSQCGAEDTGVLTVAFRPHYTPRLVLQPPKPSRQALMACHSALEMDDEAISSMMHPGQSTERSGDQAAFPEPNSRLSRGWWTLGNDRRGP